MTKKEAKDTILAVINIAYNQLYTAWEDVSNPEQYDSYRSTTALLKTAKKALEKLTRQPGCTKPGDGRREHARPKIKDPTGSGPRRAGQR